MPKGLFSLGLNSSPCLRKQGWLEEWVDLKNQSLALSLRPMGPEVSLPLAQFKMLQERQKRGNKGFKNAGRRQVRLGFT